MLVISNHSPDYSLNCTPLSPITITNQILCAEHFAHFMATCFAIQNGIVYEFRNIHFSLHFEIEMLNTDVTDNCFHSAERTQTKFRLACRTGGLFS